MTNELLLNHLRRESELLDAMLVDATAVRASLIRRDPDGLTRLLDARSHIIELERQLKNERDQLRRQLAQALNLTIEQANISAVLRTLDATSRELVRNERDRLRKRAHSLNNINRGNMMLAMRLREIATCVLSSIGGETVEQYQRSGRVDRRLISS